MRTLSVRHGPGEELEPVILPPWYLGRSQQGTPSRGRRFGNGADPAEAYVDGTGSHVVLERIIHPPHWTQRYRGV